MRIAIGNDHVALEMKLKIKEYLQEKGIAVTDVGTDSPERCDYPIYGEKVANLVAQGGRLRDSYLRHRSRYLLKCQ